MNHDPALAVEAASEEVQTAIENVERIKSEIEQRNVALECALREADRSIEKLHAIQDEWSRGMWSAIK